MSADVVPLRPRPAGPSLAPLLALTAPGMNAVNAIILDRMQSEIPLIPALAGHLISGGGKRMRPMLTIAGAALCDYQGNRHHKLAAAVEFIHTATLLHDDVVDGSDMRRGKETANIVYGNPATVLVGDFLFTRSFELMVEDGSLKVLKILSRASSIIAEGEVDQLTAQRKVETSEEHYLQIIGAKTAALFAAATRIAAVVAERSEAVGDFLAGVDEGGAGDDRAGVDPTVAGIVSAAARFSAVDLLRAHRKLDGLRTEATAQLDGIDALLVPTAPFHPTIDEVAADPVGVNSRMGTYTNFCNLFDLCAVAVPAGTVDEHDGSTAQFGVTFLGRTHHDALITDLARRFAGMPEQQRAWPERAGAPAVELAVFGAHMRTGPLTHELSSRGARWVGQVRTAPWYRLVALETAPPKPGLIREPGEGRGIRGEIWHLPPDALGEFLAALPYPMTLGKVELDDGRWVVGFGCAADAGESATPLDTDRWPLPTSPR